MSQGMSKTLVKVESRSPKITTLHLFCLNLSIHLRHSFFQEPTNNYMKHKRQSDTLFNSTANFDADFQHQRY